MPFCPTCRAEYREGTEVCRECDTRLVAVLDDVPSDEEMLDVYACYDQQQLERVRQVLEEAGIEVLMRDRASTAFPTNVGMTATKLAAVPAHLHESAATLIRNAIADGVLTDDGHVVGEA